MKISTTSISVAIVLSFAAIQSLAEEREHAAPEAAPRVVADGINPDAWDADPPSDAPVGRTHYNASLDIPEEDVTLVERLSSPAVRVYVNRAVNPDAQHPRRWYMSIQGDNAWIKIFQNPPTSQTPYPPSSAAVGVVSTPIDWSEPRSIWLFGETKFGAYLVMTRPTHGERQSCIGPVLWYGCPRDWAQTWCNRWNSGATKD